jgi:hypothetical protein
MVSEWHLNGIRMVSDVHRARLSPGKSLFPSFSRSLPSALDRRGLAAFESIDTPPLMIAIMMIMIMIIMMMMMMIMMIMMMIVMMIKMLMMMMMMVMIMMMMMIKMILLYYDLMRALLSLESALILGCF